MWDHVAKRFPRTHVLATRTTHIVTPPSRNLVRIIAETKKFRRTGPARTCATITEQHDAFQQLGIPAPSWLSYTLMIGKRSKSEMLRQMLGREARGALLGGHGQVYLWRTEFGENLPIVLIDYELHVADATRSFLHKTGGPTTVRRVDLLARKDAPSNRRHFANMLAARAISPLCDTICYFAADLNGLRGVAELLARQIMQEPPALMPRAALPRVIVVYESSAKQLDPHDFEVRLNDHIFRLLAVQDVDIRLRKHFYEIRVLCLRRRDNAHARGMQFRKRLLVTKLRTLEARRKHNLVFRRDHSLEFSHRLLDQFSAASCATFSFIENSRPEGFTLAAFSTHLTEFMAVLPCPKDTAYRELMPHLLASAILLSAFPPETPIFPIIPVYEQMYDRHCVLAFDNAGIKRDKQPEILDRLRKKLNKYAERLEKYHDGDVVASHRARLAKLHDRLRPSLQSDKTDCNVSRKTCLVCLMRPPEKVLSCRHALCDACVQTFGIISREHPFAFRISACVLCGQDNTLPAIQLIPPTAGVRVLSIDGGGVKGVVPLATLQHLEMRMDGLGVPIRNQFDLVCGTSAGE
ncbi:hypothetical protein LTR95_005990 [Oleoguttula sp. CCFEE 5521]